MMTAVSKDMDTPEELHSFIDRFYQKVLGDERLAPIFLDVAVIDLPDHLGHIQAYWEKLIFGDTRYQRHTMNIHRQLHGKKPLEIEDFQRWLGLFWSTMDENYQGPVASRAKRIAESIANNMVQHMLLEGEAHHGVVPDAD